MVKWLLCACLLVMSAQGQSPYLQHRRTASRPPPAAGGGGSNVTFDTSAKAGCGSSTTRTITITVANNSNRLLIVMPSAGDGTSSDRVVSSVSSDLDGAFTHVTSGDADDNNFVRTEAWRKTAPTVGTHTITVTYGGTVIAAEAFAISLYGVDQTTPIGTPTTASATSAAPTGAVTLGSDDMAVGGITTDSETLSWTTGTSRQVTENCDNDVSSGLATNTGTGSTSVTASTINQPYALVVLPVNGAP